VDVPANEVVSVERITSTRGQTQLPVKPTTSTKIVLNFQEKTSNKLTVPGAASRKNWGNTTTKTWPHVIYSCVTWLRVFPFLRPTEGSDDKGHAWSRHKQRLLACSTGSAGNSLQSPEITES